MACLLTTNISNACTSGIAKLNSRVDLLQVIAQNMCSAVIGNVDPYDGKLVYIAGGLTTTVTGPVGAYTLPVNTTEIHCHNCPLITSITCNSSSLTILDLKKCVILKTLVFNNCTSLPSVTLDSSFTAMTTVNFQSCSSLTSFTANSITSVSGSFVFDCVTALTSFSLTTFSATALVSAGTLKLGDSNGGSSSGPVSISFPNMTTIGAGGITILNLISTTSLSLPNLATVGGSLTLSGLSSLASISLPLLTSVSGNVTLTNNGIGTLGIFALATVTGTLDASGNATLSSFSANSLTSCPNFSATNCFSMSSISMTSINSITGTFDCSGSNSITSITCPFSSGFLPLNFNTTNCSSLQTVSFAGALAKENGNYALINCFLSVTTVDAFLASGVAASTINATYDLYGGSSDAPDAAGLANAAILVGLGNTVNTN